MNIKVKILTYEVDGSWIGEAPDLSGVLVYGATEEEVRRRAEATALRVMADRIESGASIPAID